MVIPNKSKTAVSGTANKRIRGRGLYAVFVGKKGDSFEDFKKTFSLFAKFKFKNASFFHIFEQVNKDKLFFHCVVVFKTILDTPNVDSYFEIITESGYAMALVKTILKDKAICVSYKVQETVDKNKQFLDGVRIVDFPEFTQAG